MINKLKSLITLGSALVLAFAAVSCESDLDNLGEQLLDGNSAQGFEKAFGIVAYNINNGDVIRTDASQLGYATLGAFTEPVFGMQKSSYVSQVRMPSDAFDFGTNAVVDSVVMTIVPLYQSDSLTTTTNDTYKYPVGDVDAIKVVNTYPVIKYGKSKIGNDKTKFNIKVREVTDFLGAYGDNVLSNKAVALNGNVIGSKEFDGNINSVVVTKKSDGSELLNREAGLRIPMDKDFFQNKIVAKSKQPELANAANFIRYFKGIQISVDETDGYIFRFTPTTVDIKLYYKNDVTAADGTVTRSDVQVVALSLAGINAHFNQIEYNRANTPYADAIANITEAGQPTIFAQGMGGSGFGIKIPAQTIAQLRDQFKNDKAGIVTAKIRVYTDTNLWKNSYAKPTYFTVKQKDATEFLSDMSTLANTTYSLVKAYDLDKDSAYYDFTITKTLKDIVEQGQDSKDLVLNLGSYLTNSSTGALLGVDYTDRAYTPNRIVFVGTDPSKIGAVLDSKSQNVQLRVSYAQKQIK
ncbi:DUF4270 domain-containing protein [Soonwooa sp.]|uniref:DUF4270 domain-containing protein n=1 Tax=Soonwooa sp. TaxID=1938592 RepID=UPI002628196E|nr:DUF4270 domain-containing protein [Soonwooa sp.]